VTGVQGAGLLPRLCRGRDRSDRRPGLWSWGSGGKASAESTFAAAPPRRALTSVVRRLRLPPRGRERSMRVSLAVTARAVPSASMPRSSAAARATRSASIDVAVSLALRSSRSCDATSWRRRERGTIPPPDPRGASRASQPRTVAVASTHALITRNDRRKGTIHRRTGAA
jgi:hypothetical protein